MTDQQKRNKWTLRFPSSTNVNKLKEDNGPVLTRGNSSSKLAEMQSEEIKTTSKVVKKSRSEVVENKTEGKFLTRLKLTLFHSREDNKS